MLRVEGAHWVDKVLLAAIRGRLRGVDGLVMVHAAAVVRRPTSHGSASFRCAFKLSPLGRFKLLQEARLLLRSIGMIETSEIIERGASAVRSPWRHHVNREGRVWEIIHSNSRQPARARSVRRARPRASGRWRARDEQSDHAVHGLRSGLDRRRFGA